MKVGDIVVNGEGNKRKVLAVLEEVFLFSLLNNYDETRFWHTFAEAEKHGWKIDDGEDEAEEAIRTLERLGKIKNGKIVNVETN